MEEKFTELLHLHQGIVHKISGLYFGNRIEREDYTQELIIQLWKAFPSFKEQSKFSTWMYRVCLNAAIDLLRKEKTKPELIKVDESQIGNVPSKVINKNDNQEKLYDAISLLNDIEKGIITLYLEGFSYKEIAEIVGISESNTGVKLNRIKTTLLNRINHGK